MADGDIDKNTSEIDLEDGEIDEEDEPCVNLSPLKDIQKSPDKEMIQEDCINTSSPNRKRHRSSSSMSPEYKKSKNVESPEYTVNEPLVKVVNTVKWDGYNSDEDKKIEDNSPKVINENRESSPVEKSKWSYDSDEENIISANDTNKTSGTNNSSPQYKSDYDQSSSNNNRWNKNDDDKGGGNRNNRNDSGNGGGWRGNRNNDDDNGGGWGGNRNNRNNDDDNEGGWGGNRNNRNNDDDNGGGWGGNRNNRNNDDNGGGWGGNRGNRGGRDRGRGRGGRFNRGGFNNRNNFNRDGSPGQDNDGNGGWNKSYNNRSNFQKDKTPENDTNSWKKSFNDNNRDNSPVKDDWNSKKDSDDESKPKKWEGYNSDEDNKPSDTSVSNVNVVQNDIPKSPIQTVKWSYDSDEESDDKKTEKKQHSVWDNTNKEDKSESSANIWKTEDNRQEIDEPVKWGESPVKTNNTSSFGKWGGDDEEAFGKWGGSPDKSNSYSNTDDNKWGSSPKPGNDKKWGNASDDDNNNSRSNTFNNRGGWRRNNNNDGRTRSWNNNGGNNNIKKGICKYFSMGSCRHGDNCKYTHEKPEGDNNFNKGSSFGDNNYNKGTSSFGDNNYNKGGNSFGDNNYNKESNNNTGGGYRKEAKVKELCRFYEHQQCYKRSDCDYMHEEFPCKLHHAGNRNCPMGDNCKYSHEPLNNETNGLLKRYLEERVDERTNVKSSEGYDSRHRDGLLDSADSFYHHDVMGHPRFPHDVMRMPYRYGFNHMMRYPEAMSQMDIMHRQRMIYPYPMPPPSPNRMFPRPVRGMVLPNANGMQYPMPPMMGMQPRMVSDDSEHNTDTYIDNLAQLVTGRESNTVNKREGLNAGNNSPKRLVDILDNHIGGNDVLEDFSMSNSENTEYGIQKHPSAPGISPNKTKTQEIQPGAYVPSNNMNAIQANVRLGHSVSNDQQMVYGNYPGHPNSDPAMMDYINMSAFHYFQQSNDPNLAANMQSNFERPWKIFLLEVPVKIPYPLMNIDTQDLPHKDIDPRLKGHLSITTSLTQSTNNSSYRANSMNEINDQHNSSANSEIHSGDESPLISPRDGFGQFNSRQNSVDENRSYLLDPRFKRKKANSSNNNTIESVDLI